MATVEVTDKLVGIWFLRLTDDSNWLCSLTEIEPDQRYRINYRFRYQKDDKVFDSADEKRAYKVEVTGTRTYVLATVRFIASEMKKAGAEDEIDELLMENRDVDGFLKALMEKPWAFVRVEGKIDP